MRLGRWILAGTALLAAQPAAALPPDVHAGIAIEIHAPSTFSAGSLIPVSGVVRAAVSLPVVVEVERGLPNVSVDVLVDGAVASTTTTSDDGSFHVDLTFGAQPDSHQIRAVVFRGTALESTSSTVVTSIDRFVTELRIEPAGVTVTPGGTVALRAFGLFSDGREEDVTERATWSSSDAGVASVSNAAGSKGTVTGVAPGMATISASIDGVTETGRIEVAS